MNLDTIETINKLDSRIKVATGQFFNSAVAATTLDPVLGDIFGEIRLTVFDLLFLSILSQVHILMTGPSACGKSAIAKLICSCIFGKENKGSANNCDGWFLRRLNPHLTEEKFSNINFHKLHEKDKTLRDAIKPAHFLSLPCTILDELNRCPAALTNTLFGFCDPEDPEIELLCGLKSDVGYKYQDSDGLMKRYHVVIGTMNEGEEYAGVFDVDCALRRRFTLELPFEYLRPTPEDLVQIIESKDFNSDMLNNENMCQDVIAVNGDIKQLPLDPLAFTYILYLTNIGRCPHCHGGYHPKFMSQDVCNSVQCRVLKNTSQFCPSVSGLPEGVWKFLHNACGALTALRASRMVQAIKNACETNERDSIEKLKAFTGLQVEGIQLQEAVIEKYLETISVSASDVKALLPFAGLGDKIWISKEYVAKKHRGSYFHALQTYTQVSYSQLETMFRDNQDLFNQFEGENDPTEELLRRFECAEHFNDPYIRHTIEPLLIRKKNNQLIKDDAKNGVETYSKIRDVANKIID